MRWLPSPCLSRRETVLCALNKFQCNGQSELVSCYRGLTEYLLIRRDGILWKKCATHLVSLIKVEGLLVPNIVTNFDIVNPGTSVQRYIYLKPS